MKIFCLLLLLTAPIFAESKGKEIPTATNDSDAQRLRGFSRGEQLVKPAGNPNSCTSMGTTYSKNDAGYAACARSYEATQTALGGKNPNNVNSNDVMKITPMMQNRNN